MPDSADQYEQLLSVPPPRKRWVKADVWVAVLILIMGAIAIGQPLLWKLISSLGIQNSESLVKLSIYCSAILAGLVLIGGGLRLNPQWRSVRLAKKRFPRVWQAIKALRDRSRGEVFNDFLPVLIVGNRTLLVVSYRHLVDRRAQIPIATLLLDEQGQVIADDQLFEQAYTTFNYALNATIPAQSRLDTMKRAGRKLVSKDIPRAANALRHNQHRFEILGDGKHLSAGLEGLPVLREMVQETDRFLAARAGYVRAAGYGHSGEFHYEDADRFEQLGVAFARLLEERYAQPLQELSLRGEYLRQRVETQPTGWKDKKQLLLATRLLADSRKAIQRWIDAYGAEARVPETTWTNYHEKLQRVRAQGTAVSGGGIP